MEGSFSPAITVSLIILPSPDFTVEDIGAKGVAEAAGADLLALVFLLEGSFVGGLIVGEGYYWLCYSLPDYQTVLLYEQVP